MNIGQMVRNQQRMMQIATRANYNLNQYSATQPDQSALSSLSTQLGTNDSSLGNIKDANSLMESWGYVGIKGRTVRDMAKYQMQLRENAAEKVSQTQQSASDLTAGLNLSIGTNKLGDIEFSTVGDYWRKTIPVDAEMTKEIQNLALDDAKYSFGDTSGRQRSTKIQDYLQSVAPAKRFATYYTLNKVWENEVDRIGDYIRKNDSNWTSWGDKFDTGILDNYQPGLNVWV